MLSKVLTIARTTFIESVRQPIYFLLIVICGLGITFAVSSTGFTLGSTSEAAEVKGDNKLLLDLSLATVFLIGTLMAGFIATSAISREIENKTILTVVSKPVPRAAVIIGKFLGVSGAMSAAIVQMIVFLLLGIRHGVMSTSAHEVDWPVIVFGFGALGLAVFVAVWGNFFYSWHFTQTASLLLLPLIVVAYVLVLLVSPKWEIQAFAHDLKPQVLVACVGVLAALLVLTSVAIAASCRLGQVMTIVICMGTFVLGLMSNHFVGRHVFAGEPYGRALSVEAIQIQDSKNDFRTSNDRYAVLLRAGPSQEIAPGMPVWYGPSANGAGIAHPNYTPYAGKPESEEMVRYGVPSALIIESFDKVSNKVVIRNIGGEGLAVSRPPQPDDYLFAQAPTINVFALAISAAIPNFQWFWLLDAVTQNQPVPESHLLLLGLYAVSMVVVFLSLAILLFEGRDVG